MPAIGWITNTTEADGIFALRLENASWFASGMTNDRKTAALTQAFERIIYSGQFDLDETTVATTRLKKAQCEMAYYMVLHLLAEDRRKGLQAQNVLQAGVVEEVYTESGLNEVPIPGTVRGMLKEYSKTIGGFYVASLDRNENRQNDTKMEDGVVY